ncbi:MAG: hypothetical protein QOD49_2566, partial [Actinomycetota bacterium]|nr:hypothetical protein [Actinomycetota bacterium]
MTGSAAIKNEVAGVCWAAASSS